MLEPHPAFCQLVDRTIDIVHRKIENTERRRNVVRLRINDHIIAAGQMQPEETMVLRGLSSRRLIVKPFLLPNVRRRDSTERFAVFQHDNPPYCNSSGVIAFGSQTLFSASATPHIIGSLRCMPSPNIAGGVSVNHFE